MPKSSKYAHLNKENRILISNLINNNESIRKISKVLEVSPTTISNELKDRRYIPNPFNPNKCQSGRLDKAPWVCNGCENFRYCRKCKKIYDPFIAHSEYLKILSKSRSHIMASEEGLKYVNDLVSPLIKDKGQTIDHILSSNDVGISKSTLYRYIDKGLLDVKNIDLKRRVRYSKRRSKPKEKIKEVPVNKKGKKYLDYLVFKKAHPYSHVVEMDTVIGKRDEEMCLMTLLLKESRFMLIYLLKSKSSEEVIKVLDSIEKIIDKSHFRTIFNIILTDNGSEFSLVEEIEGKDRSIKRCNLFFCDPRHSEQKGSLEKNHEYIRYYLPKGISFKDLSQDDVTLMANHINSIRRVELRGKTPFDCLTPYQLRCMKKLGYNPVQANDVIVSAKLFKK